MSQLEENLHQIGRKIDQQVLRVSQRDVQELREQYEKARKKEIEANQMLLIERSRSKTQEREIDRRRKQLEESTDLIRKLQTDLDESRRVASGVKWELRENEIRSMTESEIFRYRAQTNCLETKLKRKQMELELAQEQMKNSQESLEREISDLKEALKAKEKAIEGYILEIENRNSIYGELDSRQQMEVLHERIGSLSATVESLQDRIDALQAEKLDLDNKLAYAEQDKSVLKSQINSLKTELNDNEGTSQQTSSYLNEEIEKLKHQKAQLRLEHLQLKKDYAKLEAENNDLKNGPKNSTELESKFSESEAQISRLEKENNLLKSENNYQKRQLEALQKSANEFNEKLKHYEKTTKENEESENARVQQLSSELQVSREKMTSMRTTLIELDTQCDRLMNKLKELDQDKISMQDENNQLRKESEELRGQVESQCKIEGELTTLREENSRLRGKIRYLENEVKESHTDHSQELARLAKQLSQAKSSQTQSSSSNGQLEAEVRQKDSHIRYNERQIQQLKKDLEEIKKEAEAERKRQCDLVNENTTLRQGLAEAIKKTGQYRDEGEKLKQVNESIRANAEVLNEKLLRLEDDVQELQIELEQKEKLASYLQSVVQPKQMQKINRNYSSLISTGSDAVSDIEAESQKCAKLERERNTVLENLERRRRILQEKQNLEIESVPLIKNNATKMPMSPRTRKKDAASPASLGTMRHEIPHRWKKQFISINISSLHCAVCFEGLPHFGHIYKCRECSLMVHAHCKPSITNTCGLPPACATFYVDPHSAPSGIMTGWIKLWRSDDLTGNKWRNSWAVIDDNKLSFYDDDSFATNNRSPFLTIDLNSEQWKIYNQVGTPGLNVNGITKEHMSLVIEIKLPSFTLFMLGPTMQAKERWVRALQNATNRRAFVQRRPSTSTAYSMLLGLDKPRNLVITCTQILDHDWLLMGCQEGLFVTTLSNPKAPFNVAGIQNIYFMEIIVEQGHEMLFAICGINRRPVVTHLQQLRGALKADQQPTIEPTFVTNIDDCHSCVVSKPGIHSKRYVYLATTDAIHILEFVRKLGVFQPLNQVIKTEEPCMCICSTYNGLIFGADNFHLVTWESGFSCRQLSIDNCPSDFPVAAIEISPTEFLLAFHNYGVFVDAQGKRSRKENIEWERVPLEFAFSTPHLYIVYCDFLEVATVPTNEGYDTPALTDDRSMFRCRSAHKTGFGNRHGDIMFAVSSADRVELHMFNSSNVDMTTSYHSMADNKKRSPFLLSKQYGRLTGLVKSKFSSSKSKSGGYSVESDDINFNYMATSTPNIHKIQANGRTFYLENDDVLLHNKRPGIARQSSYYSPQTQRSSYINVPGSGEYVRNRCLSISTVSNSLQRRIEQNKKERVRNQSVDPDSPEASNAVGSPPHIKRAQRSNSAHALAGSMYAIRQPLDQNLVNRFAKNDGRQSTYDDGNAQYHCNCRHCKGGGLTSACMLQNNMEISYHPGMPAAPRPMHHSYSSRSLPRRKDSRPNSLYQPPAGTTGNCAFPTQNNQHDNFQSPYADQQLYRDSHAQPQPIDQNQTQPNSEPQVGSVPSDMFFGTADRRKKPTPMGATHPMNGNATGRSALHSSFIGNTPLSPVNYVGHPVYPQQQQSTFPAHKENVYDNPTHFSSVRDQGHETASHASTTVSSSSGTIGSSSVENYFYGTAPGNRSTAEENVFNATANFSPDTLSHSSTPVGTSSRMKSKSSNKLNLTSVLGRHSKATTPVANQDPSFGTPDHWPIDHPNHAKALDSYEKSLVLYGHGQPTVTSPTVNQPGCSNGYGMSRSSSTQGFVGKEYFESPQMYATNHMIDHSEAVRRSTSNHNDLTEPIVVLAKQVASKEVEIDRLKSQLNRRSSRADSQRAQFEDELAAQRREADYNREQASKLKTKLRQTETECATAKAKKEELEKKLETLTSTYEQRIEAMEKENAQQRKEYARMKELEEAYEKYIDEKDWLEKQSESLNHKLDEHESSLHLSEQECHQLKLEIERLQDCLKEKEQEIHELSLLSATSRLDIVDSDSEDGGENYEEENMGVRKSLKEAKRRANGKQKQSVETGIRKPSRPNLLLNPASSSSTVIQPLSRSSSSTPDSSAAPPSVSSSGVSSFGGGKLSAYESTQFSVGKHLSRCQRKLQVCQKKLNSLLETTQRIQSGGKPTKQDILGSASESDADFMDFEHLASHNEKAMDKALEEHFAQISRLYQNIEKLHGSLLAVYGRSRAQTNNNAKDPCRMQ